MDGTSVFVTGANRGIGLELVRQIVRLANPPRYVFATYRNEDKAQNLEAIKNSSNNSQVFMIKMDVQNKEDIVAARKIVEDKVGEKGLNLLINNAGALTFEGFPEITEENLLFHFKTNTLGPISVLKEMLPLLQKAALSHTEADIGISKAAVLNISSVGASCFKTNGQLVKEFDKAFGYRISKAALNLAMRVVTQEVKEQGILVANMCPGWVRTDMGTSAGRLDVQESVSAIVDTCHLLNKTHQGAFLDRFGEPIPF